MALLAVEYVIITAYFILLIASIYMLISFYVCDNHTCKVFNLADRAGPTGSKEYVTYLVDNIFNDGIWPVPYIGSSILTILGLWLLKIPFTPINYGTMFLIGFLTIYALFSFVGHHYVHPITTYTSNYISNNTMVTYSDDDADANVDANVDANAICIQPNEYGVHFEPYAKDLGFPTPINIF